MGHRMEIYLSPEHAQEVIEISRSFGIEAQIIGRVEADDHAHVTLTSEFGTFEY
jgi:phosphoribosylformylglycinamidine cyclo-ligase